MFRRNFFSYMQESEHGVLCWRDFYGKIPQRGKSAARTKRRNVFLPRARQSLSRTTKSKNSENGKKLRLKCGGKSEFN